MINDNRFTTLEKYIDDYDVDKIVSLGNELFQEYYFDWGDEYKRLSEIFLKLILADKGYFVYRFVIDIDENSQKEIGADLFVDYVESKMNNFINHVESQKALSNEELMTLKEGIFDDILDISYSIIYGWLWTNRKILNKNEIDTGKDIYSKSFFNQMADKVFSVGYVTLNIGKKHTPNKKYSEDMFEYTRKLIYEDGKSQKAACLLTLEEFKKDVMKYESYGRQYRDSIKKWK